MRGFPGEGVRVTVGTRADNDAFLAACEAWLKESGDQAGDPGAQGRAVSVREEK